MAWPILAANAYHFRVILDMSCSYRIVDVLVANHFCVH